MYHSILKKEKKKKKEKESKEESKRERIKTAPKLVLHLNKRRLFLLSAPTHPDLSTLHLVVLVVYISKMRFYISLPQLLVIRKAMLSFIKGVWSG